MAPPEPILIEEPRALERLKAHAGDLVFKPVWSRFAARVLIRPAVAALDRIVPTPQAPWIAQEFISGEGIAADCKADIGRTRWTGQISFDFRRDDRGRLRVLACNPRATSGVHFFGPPSQLAATFLEGLPSQPSMDHPLMIPAAMWLYGLPAALRNRRLAARLHAPEPGGAVVRARTARCPRATPLHPAALNAQGFG